MVRLSRFYRLINLLSLDVVAGAICSCLFIASFLRRPLEFPAVVCLGLSVWTIYTFDHLLDASAVKGIASSPRHRYHQRHFRHLGVAVICAALLELGILFAVSTTVLLHGLLMIPVLVIYFAAQARLKIFKELFIAVLYTVGVLIPSKGIEGVSGSEVLFILAFLLTALSNLLLFSLFDQESDRRDSHTSFVLAFGTTVTKRVLIVLFIVTVVLCGMAGFNLATLIIIVMSSILLLMMMFSDLFQIEDRYRIVGEAVFFLPTIYLLFS